ncbi:MAG: hypothetical protein V1929_09075 [bacterium]
MKTIVVYPNRPDPCPILHVETPLGVVNIQVGLHDAQGREVVSISVCPQHFAGEPKVMLRGWSNTRLVQCKHAREI